MRFITKEGRVEFGYFAVLALVFVGPGILGGAVPAFRDFLVLVVPLRFFAARSVAAGELPLWTDDLFFGAPFLANYQSAIFYPPSLLLYLLPEPVGFSWMIGLHLALAGLGMSAFLRGPEGLDRASATFGGTIYAAGGFFASLLPLTNHLQAAAWLPWILVAGDHYLRRGDRRGFLGLTLLFATQVLAGAPETVILTGLLLGAHLVRRRIAAPAPAHRFAGVAASALLAASLCAIQLVPTLEYVGESDRAGGLSFAAVAAESIEPRSLQQFILPHTFSNGAPDLTPEGGVPLFWSIHIGAAGIALAAAVSSSPFWIGVVLVGLAFSLGPALPFLGMLHEIAPTLVGAFRYPGKIFILCHAGFAVLAARGAANALTASAAARRAGVLAGMAALLTVGIAMFLWIRPGAALAVLGFDLRPNAPEHVLAHLANGVALTAVRFAVFSSVAAFLLSTAARRTGASPWIAPLLVLVAATDLSLLHRPILGYVDSRALAARDAADDLGLRPRDRVFHYCRTGFGCGLGELDGIGVWRGTLRAGIAVKEQARSLSQALVPNVSLLYGVGAVAGTDGVTTRAQRELELALRILPPDRGAHLLAALGTTALIGREPLPGLPAPFSAGDGVLVTTVAGSAPHAYLAERIIGEPDVRSAFARMADASFRPGKDAVVSGLIRRDEGQPGSVVVLERGPHVHRYRVQSEKGSVLVENDIWYPGWVATVDGRDARLLKANGITRAVEVPPGLRDVVIAYHPRSIDRGLYLTAIAAGILLIAVLLPSSMRSSS